MMRTQTVNFEVVGTKHTRKFKCAHCGKQRQRTREFAQTLNPWNRDESGHVKDRAQIQHEIREEAKVWFAAPNPLCAPCERADNEAKYKREDEEDDE